MFTDVFFYVNIDFALGIYCIQNLRQKSNWEGDGLRCKAGPQVWKQAHNNVISLSDSCLDVIEEAHQVIANPKSHCTAHYLKND